MASPPGSRALVALAALALSRAAAAADPCDGNQAFRVGAAIRDITGPPADVPLMGYAMPHQRSRGIHTRLHARAAVIASPCNGKRVAIVAAEIALLTQAVKQEVVRQLKARFGDTYSEANVLLAATHTHSGPGGVSHYFLYNLPALGFSEQNFRAVSEGIAGAIAQAHENLADGRVKLAAGDLLEASVNRSAPAYERNPAAERGRYGHDTDKRMTVVRLEEADGTEIGVLDWYAVHATSMGNTNRLISSDNKGYASLQFEKAKGTKYTEPKTFVAAFFNANEGDVSPNIDGKEDGPDDDDFADTQLSGEKQYRRARELYEQAGEALAGGVDFRHAHVKLDAVTVEPALADGQPRRTCPAAIGLSMLAGAEDGRGVGREGLACNPEWAPDLEFLCALATPCQGEKPIALEMGTRKPVPWTPEVLPLQILRVGRLVLVNVPFELSTMAGRRLRETVVAALGAHRSSSGPGEYEVVLTGLSNAYAGYVVTREEYAIQHYEGASTHFGPWTLAALQQETRRLAVAMREGRPVDPGPAPRDLSQAQDTLLETVLFDEVPAGGNFGDAVEQPRAGYRPGDTARATFWSGNPNNDLELGSSYLQVQHREGEAWTIVAVDRDWETKFHWRRFYCPPTLQCSQATIEWVIPGDTPPGVYRIRHDGHHKDRADGKIRPYTGFSREFEVR